MKKLFSVFILLSVLSVSTLGIVANSCDSCSKRHIDSKASCHAEKEEVKQKSCCSTETQRSEKSCDMNGGSPNDCQICAHTDQPPAKIEASVNLKMDNKFIIALPESQNAFSNQIPPPDTQLLFSTHIPPITANHLAFLESIRLLI